MSWALNKHHHWHYCAYLIAAMLLGLAGCQTTGPWGRGRTVMPAGGSIIAQPTLATPTTATPTNPQVAIAPATPITPNPVTVPQVTVPPTNVNPPGHYSAASPRIILSPHKMIAPVGSEVVLLAGVCRVDGYYGIGDRIQWTIDPSSVGQFVAPSKSSWHWFSSMWDSDAVKIVNNLAISKSIGRSRVLTRGTYSKLDDVCVKSGQAWIVVSSPVEGTSHVSAYSPKIKRWPERRQTATIHWIDAQWGFPAPAIKPAGTKHTLTTSVSRASNSAPLVGWIVRYEIASGPAAGFAPSGKRVVEVVTGPTGQSSVELLQNEKTQGTNQINIQIIRPATSGSQRVVMGSGVSTVSWSAPVVGVHCTGPSQMTIGSQGTYKVKVFNTGGAIANNLTVTMPKLKDFDFVNTSANAKTGGEKITWNIDQLPANQTREFEVTYQAKRAGKVSICAEVFFSQQATAKNCVTTTITPKPARATLGLSFSLKGGGNQVQVGQTAIFYVDVTNHGSTPATGVVVKDQMDLGLQHASGGQKIEQRLGTIAVGETRKIAIQAKVTKAGKLYQTLEVLADGGYKESKTLMVEAILPPPQMQAKMEISVSVDAKTFLGDIAAFYVEVKNTGNTDLTNLIIRDVYTNDLDPKKASGFKVEEGNLIWRIDRLKPGETKTGQINAQARKLSAAACNTVTATCDQNIVKSAKGCTQVIAPVGGASQLTMTVTTNRNPARIGDTVIYTVTLSNRGRIADKNAVLEVTLPFAAEVVKVVSGVQYKKTGQTLRFQPVLQLKPGEEFTYKIHTKVKVAGRADFEATVSSTNQTTPLKQKKLTNVIE